MSSVIWGPVSLVPGDEAEQGLGTLRLRLRRSADELWLRSTHVGEGPGDSASAAPAARTGTGTAFEGAEDWVRWALPATDRIELRPA
ncbi:MAG: hypothetical protein OEN00_17245, partial [Gemmatimonadota bacterium]|nr:hypothetical protein [Gemmatimonadota bacterium]